MNVTVLALGLYRSSGGPAKSVKAFAAALDAHPVSWVDPIQYAREPLVWERTTVVRGRWMPPLRQLLVPRADDAQAAERLVAASSLVSCHSFWRWHTIWLARVAERHRVPYWFVPHGSLDPFVFSSGRLAKQWFLAEARPFLSNAAAVVCATRREYEKLAPLVPTAQPIVLPWPLDDDDFRLRDPVARLAERRSLGIPEEAFCLLFFGRLDPMKRPLETIDAVAAAGIDDVHLIMMGNEFGVSRTACVERARQLGIERRVHVVGPRYGAEKHACVNAADAFISLSHRENFNYTAAECMAAGLPVILSPGNDLAGDLDGTECGALLDTTGNAPQAIADLCRMSSATRQRLGSNGRRWAEDNLRHSMFHERLREHALRIAR